MARFNIHPKHPKRFVTLGPVGAQYTYGDGDVAEVDITSHFEELRVKEMMKYGHISPAKNEPKRRPGRPPKMRSADA